MMKIHEAILCLSSVVLLAVLVGAAAQGGKAFEVSCRDHLQKISRLSASYAADNDDGIVRMLERPNAIRGVWWCDKLKNYASDFRVFYCPANKWGELGLKQDDLLPFKYTRKYVSYGINGHISGVHKREQDMEKISNIKNPSYLLYFGDAGRVFMLRAIGKLWEKDYNPVHDRHMIAVMADGHTEKFDKSNLGTFGKIPGWERDKFRWRNWKD